MRWAVPFHFSPLLLPDLPLLLAVIFFEGSSPVIFSHSVKPSDNYRKPPVEYQFKKSQSSNPKGRPPKKKVVPPTGSSLGGGIEDRVSAMVLAEANRLIEVPEGNKVSKIPAIQALLRTMITTGAKGDSKVAAKILDVVARVESARAIEAQDFLAYAAEYKEKHEGLDLTDIYPHPDDFVINEYTGEVTIDGPKTKEEAGARKAVREIALQATARYFEVKFALAKDPENQALRKEFNELQKYIDFLERDSARDARHKALRLARRALEPKPDGKEDEQPDD